jgi:hypothetical protein
VARDRDQSGVLTVGRQDFAVRLIWRSIDNPDADARAVASTEAKELGGDLFVKRQGESLLIGLGDSRIGHRPGMPVLGLALLDQFSGSTLAAFPVPGGVYLIAVRDEQIMSGIEGVVPDVEEARERFAELADRASWRRLIAPAEWRIQDAVPGSLDETLEDLAGFDKLRPIARTREIMAVAAGVAVAIGVAGWWWQSEQERIQEFLLQQQLLLSAERAAREERLRAAMTQRFPDPSWAGKSPARIMVRACVEAVQGIPVTVPGWTAIRAECSDGVVHVQYRRDDGSILEFQSVLRGLARPPAMSHQGNDVRLSWRFQENIPALSYDQNVTTQPVAVAQRGLAQRLEAAHVFQYAFQTERGSPVRILNAEGDQVEAVLEQSLRLTATIPGERMSRVRDVGDGMVATLRSLSLDFGSMNWTLQLDAHERLGVPGLRVPGVPAPAPVNRPDGRVS